VSPSTTCNSGRNNKTRQKNQKPKNKKLELFAIDRRNKVSFGAACRCQALAAGRPQKCALQPKNKEKNKKQKPPTAQQYC